MAELKEFLYVLRPTRVDMLKTGATETEKAAIGEHFRYLKSHCDQGVVVTAGRTTTEDESAFGICVFRAADADAAKALMNGDPAVTRGVMSARLLPFRIAMLTNVQ